MKDAAEINLKRAYWSGVYYALDPAERHGPEESKRVWLTAETWLTALDWALGRASNSATTLRPLDVKTEGWDT